MLSSLRYPRMSFPTIARATSSKEAMAMLINIFSSKTRSRIMTLKRKLSLVNQKDKSVEDHLQTIRSIVDKLALAQAPVDDDDLVIIILNGLSPSFHSIPTALQAWETPIFYEDLHEKLTNFETVLKQHEAANITPIVVYIVQRGRPYYFSP